MVTGGARRVGREIVHTLADAGCAVAVHYHQSAPDAASLKSELDARGARSCLIQADLADPANWSRIVTETIDALGALHILVHNASCFDDMTLENFDAAAWDRSLRINLTAAAGLAHHAAPHLAQAPCAKIINLTDVSAERPWTTHLAYCAAKAGLVNLTRALAKALAPTVQVNAIAPGIALFPDHYDAPTRERLVRAVPLRRPGEPRDIAQTVRFLCEHGDYITGQVITVDGGRSIS